LKEIQFTSHHTRLLEEYQIPLDGLQGVKALEYEKGEFICIEGLPIYDLLFVIEGKAKVCFQAEDGKRLLLCFYHRGGMIGEVELMMNDNTAKTSIQTISAVTCIGLPLVQNRNQLLSSTAFLHYIGTTLARKLDRCSRNSAHIILDTLQARLSSYIEITNREGVFQDKLTDVAELLGTSYRHLLRVLEILCKQGILEKRTRGYGINNLAALKQNGQGFYDPVEKKSVHGSFPF
jgi:CRP/FNR family transcriptional regulator, putaive post-exponential-phase nitrogen-starvation regulator